MRVLYQVETPDTKAGKPGKRQKVRMGSGGNPRTIALGTAIEQTAKLKTDPLPPVAEDNIKAIAEIRNAAIHFINADEGLCERVWQLGTGSLKNFMRAAQDWFGCDLSEHRLFMMPLAFVQPENVAAVSLKERAREITNLTAFLDELEKRHAGIGADKPFVMGLKLEFKLAASRQADAPAVRLTVDPKAPAVRLSEDELKERFPLTYDTLVEKLQARYSEPVSERYRNVWFRPKPTARRVPMPIKVGIAARVTTGGDLGRRLRFTASLASLVDQQPDHSTRSITSRSRLRNPYCSGSSVHSLSISPTLRWAKSLTPRKMALFLTPSLAALPSTPSDTAEAKLPPISVLATMILATALMKPRTTSSPTARGPEGTDRGVLSARVSRRFSTRLLAVSSKRPALSAMRSIMAPCAAIARASRAAASPEDRTLLRDSLPAFTLAITAGKLAT